jgi:hypothetical protein
MPADAFLALSRRFMLASQVPINIIIGRVHPQCELLRIESNVLRIRNRLAGPLGPKVVGVNHLAAF